MYSEMHNEQKEEVEHIEQDKHSVPSTSSLLLNDTEQFTFDFGNDTENNDDIVAGGHLTQEYATDNREINETQDGDILATRRKGTSRNKQIRSVVKPTRIMTREEVNKCVLHALAHNPRNFLTLPTVSVKKQRETNHKMETNTDANTEKGKAKKKMQNKEKEEKSEEIEKVEMTMADAILQFQAGLRRYDENLWRAQKVGQSTKTKSANNKKNDSGISSSKQTRQGVKRQRVNK